ncbi:MAG: tRNA (adenosine(37)-N6)-threonylcarbamoyltransferase complex dimerization subunit type 1 TsaB [Deltaproteobacteria bacterium RIFCSPHIGHO2_02_FULL_40_11]|nr:MAG: tRNA (adenosine(37)-N6)-threonylcarbamoyltransferase complex dimerization subunit type 1 TsaB [Deltaproteobacteria bacterium RIFCSPHIGHO2_02_FULL_40_11]
MKLLAFETSTSVSSVALFKDHFLLAESTLELDASHSEHLLPTVDLILKQTGNQISEIDFFGVACGPGSFTGLRVSLATVQAFAKQHEKNIASVSTLQAMSLNGYFFPGLVCSLLDARQNEVYAGAFRFSAKGKCTRIFEDAVFSCEALVEKLQAYDESILLIGYGVESYKDQFMNEGIEIHWAPPHICMPKATHVGILSYEAIRAGKLVSPDKLVPNYIRIPLAQTKLSS